MRRSVFVVLALVASLFSVVVVSPATAEPVHGGKEWNQLYPTVGLTWAQVASVCPPDGATPCDGTVGGNDLSGWVWATAPQVLELMELYAPGISAATPPAFSGPDAFFYGVGFLNDFRWTTYTALTYFYQEYTSGWTASLDGGGLPIAGGASYQHPFFSGSIGVGSLPDGASSDRGVFLWRTAGLDYTAPVVTPTVAGTLGNNGWYRSDVAISWNVVDAESPVVSTSGCEPTSVMTDTASASATCTATSAGLGGAGSASVTVKRDATPPVVTCGAAPTFSLAQPSAQLTGTVADATSGAVSAMVSTPVSTTVAGPRTATLRGSDRAGNAASTTCPYQVVVPTCGGKVATIVGSAANDTITGTSGADVIIGLTGADTISGGGGNDVICGGDGNDTITGGDGADTISGGDGRDDLYGGGQADDLDGGLGLDSIRGDAGADRCTSGEVRMSSCAILY
jgi:Ca2+-binding RTX toxin-like protein